jgi:hypothetical protein
MHKRNVSIMQILSVVAMLCNVGCIDKKEIPVPVEPAKSKAYFSKHNAEAEVIAKKCLAMYDNELSVKSPVELEAWRQTPAGINCTNAMEAAYIARRNAQQKAYEDSAKRF